MHVIDKHSREGIQIRFEHTVHQIHKCCWDIGQPKRHQELIITITSLEGCLWDILNIKSQLRVNGPQVNLREHYCSLKLVE